MILTQFSGINAIIYYSGDIFKRVGFANPSTADSWAEGFAAFMSVEVANANSHYWAKYPSQTNPALYPYSGSLETNYLAWGDQGFAEEFAIASFLWDLVDDKDDDTVKLFAQAKKLIKKYKKLQGLLHKSAVNKDC
jgi:hypothetical protein